MNANLSDQELPYDDPPTDPHLVCMDRHSYLLRLWRNGAAGGWRASLQSVQTGERHMFADLESLLAFLCDHARSPPAP
jgi:hypothetical protein